MFEALVTGLLTSLLGSFIEEKCFSSDKVNVGVWSGYVVMHSLEIKPDFVTHPALRLARGMIGSVEIKIPWNRLHSDSVIITVDDMYLLLASEEDLLQVLEEEDAFTLKKLLLEKFYEEARKKLVSEAISSAEEGYTTRLINKIIDNIELHFRRIHIRLEDRTSGDHPFSVGLTVESVHAQSTNSSWQPCYIDRAKSNEPRIYKSIELNHLSLYVNPHCEMSRDDFVNLDQCTLDEFSNAMNLGIPKRSDDRFYESFPLERLKQFPHHFVLKPVDASARVIINRDLADGSMPNFEIDVSIDEVAFRFEDKQFCDLLYLMATFEFPAHFRKYQKYRQYRPKQGVFDSQRGEWWRYAIRCVLHNNREKKQRWTWPYMKQRREDRHKYIALWCKKGRTKTILPSALDEDDDEEESEEQGEEDHKSVGDEDKREQNGDLVENGHQPIKKGRKKAESESVESIESALEEIERRREVEDILFFRYLADLEVLKDQSIEDAHHPPESQRQSLPGVPSDNCHEQTQEPSAPLSDTESVETDSNTEISMMTDYRSWGTWMFGWTSRFVAKNQPQSDEKESPIPKRIIPDVELRQLFRLLEYEPSKRERRKHQHQENGDAHGSSLTSSTDDEGNETIISRISITLLSGSFTLSGDPNYQRKHGDDDDDSVDASEAMVENGDLLDLITSYEPTDFFVGTFSHLQVAVINKKHSTKVDVSLQSINAYDESSDNTAFPQLLSRRRVNTGTPNDFYQAHRKRQRTTSSEEKFASSVFLMSYESNPSHSTADAVMYVHVEPLEVVVSPTACCWARMACFFDTPKVLGVWEEMEVASLNDIVNLRSRTEAKLKYVMAHRVAMSIDMTIQAPVIVIPSSDTDLKCTRVVIDLGMINFRTERLSKLDNETCVKLSQATSSSSHSNSINSDPNGLASSLVLFQRTTPGDVSSSTSFVRQLYDEAERGEGAIRWKEEFYDKFSLSVTNIQILLLPYGHGPHILSQVVEAPSQHRPMYQHNTPPGSLENDYDLVEKFNFNVILRKSVLPLDATLTQFYVHADLPALTIKLGMEKYAQLMGLIERFSPKTSDEPEKAEQRRRSKVLQRSLSDLQSIKLSSEALKRFTGMNDNKEASSTTLSSQIEGSDALSEQSDDTWFSINEDDNNPGMASTGSIVGSNRIIFPDANGPTERNEDQTDQEKSSQFKEDLLKKASIRTKRALHSGVTAVKPSEIINRRAFVCTFSFPRISILFKKPMVRTVNNYYSMFRFERYHLDEESIDNGTIVARIEGLRVRCAKKTLTTQMNLSLRSLEMEDLFDASGATSEYLVFSCPSIQAPFAAQAPLIPLSTHHPEAGWWRTARTTRARVNNRRRESVISFRRQHNGSSEAAKSNAISENLVEMGVSLSSGVSGSEENLKEVDVNLGALHFVFDQSYVCSLLEMIEAAKAEHFCAESKKVESQTHEVSEDDNPEKMPYLDLAPTGPKEYFPAISLTDSVRADLENARNMLLAQVDESSVSSGNSRRAKKPKPFKIRVKFQSLSMCVGDRGVPVTSLAVLRSEMLLKSEGTASSRVVIDAKVGDLKIFDVLTQRQSSSQYPSPAQRFTRPPRGQVKVQMPSDSPHRDFVEVFGLSLVGSNQLSIASLECTLTGKTSSVSEATPNRSSLKVCLQPVRLFANIRFLDELIDFMATGPLARHFAHIEDRDDNSSSRSSSPRRTRAESLEWTEPVSTTTRDRAATSPSLASSDPNSPWNEAASPFFDAVADNNTIFRLSRRITSSQDKQPVSHRPDEETAEASVKKPFSLLDWLDIDVKLMHPMLCVPIVENDPAAFTKTASIDFGEIHLSLRNKRFGSSSGWSATETTFSINRFHISAGDETIWQDTAMNLRVVIPTSTESDEEVDIDYEANTFDQGVPLPRSESIDEMTKPVKYVSASISPICINVSDFIIITLIEVQNCFVEPLVASLKKFTMPISEVPTPLLRQPIEPLAANPRDPQTDTVAQVPATEPPNLLVEIGLQELTIVLRASASSAEAMTRLITTPMDDYSTIDRQDAFADLFATSSILSKQRYGDANSGKAKSNNAVRPARVDVRYVPVLDLSLKRLRAKYHVTYHGKHCDQTAESAYQLDLLAGEISVHDRIADENNCVSTLIGPVPSQLPNSLSLSTPRARASFSSTHSSTPSTTGFDSCISDFNGLLDSPQFHLRFTRHQQPLQKSTESQALGDSEEQINHQLSLRITSVRLIALPRTFLRAEFWACELLTVVTPALNHFARPHKITQDSDGFVGELVVRSDGSSIVVDGREEVSFSRPKSSKRAASIKTKKDLTPKSGSRATHAAETLETMATSVETLAPVQENDTEAQDESGGPVADAFVVKSHYYSFSRWQVEVDLADLQVWLLSNEEKDNAMGVGFSSRVKASVEYETGSVDVDATSTKSLRPFHVKVKRVSDSIKEGKFMKSALQIDLVHFGAGSPGSKIRPGHVVNTIVEPLSASFDCIGYHCIRCALHDGETDGESSSDDTKQVLLPENELEKYSTTAPDSMTSNIPAEWCRWSRFESTCTVEKILSRLSYRELPIFLRIGGNVGFMLDTASQMHKSYDYVRLKMQPEPRPSNSGDSATTEAAARELGAAVFPEDDDLRSLQKTSSASKHLAHLKLELQGFSFTLINNMGGQESPVVEVLVEKCDIDARDISDVYTKLLMRLSCEAWYYNLRLAVSEPLLEPYRFEFLCSQEYNLMNLSMITDNPPENKSPLTMVISSKDILQLNFTDALVANLTAAMRAWQWVIDERGRHGNFAKYSTYWIRNETGIPLSYWGPACRMSKLDPGQEEPLEFVENGPLDTPARLSVLSTDSSFAQGNESPNGHRALSNRSHHGLRQLFIAVEAETDQATSFRWKSEVAISVDQADSRVYALVNDSDTDSGEMHRKCECVIDVVVENGCKYFVVRSTLLIDNQTASELNVEYEQPTECFDGSVETRILWRSLVKESSVVAVPIHLVAAEGGTLWIRPPEMQGANIQVNYPTVLPRAYARQQIELDWLRSTLANHDHATGITNRFQNPSSNTMSVMKFHRLHKNRPVRPFIVSARLCLPANPLSFRRLSFHPPLIIHNFTAAALDYCLSTPHSWKPPSETMANGTDKLSTRGWEDTQQRLRERGTIEVADSLVWHLSDWETPLELRVRMKGFDWSEAFLVMGESESAQPERIQIRDAVSDAILYITAETKWSEGCSREISLYVPYWIINLSGLALELEHDPEIIGHEHMVPSLAGQKLLNREQISARENSENQLDDHTHEPNPLLISSFQQENPDLDEDLRERPDSPHPARKHLGSPKDRRRRFRSLLPSLPPIRGFLDLVPTAFSDNDSSQLEILHSCHSNHRRQRGSIRLRVMESDDSSSSTARYYSKWNRFSTRFGWSKPFSMDQSGTSGEIEVIDTQAERRYCLGYSISNAKGLYSRTKIVMLTPRYVVVNMLNTSVEVCHSSPDQIPSAIASSDAVASQMRYLEPGTRVDFHWAFGESLDRTIRCRYAEYGWTWSGCVPLLETGEFMIRMRHEPTREAKMVRVVLKSEVSCVCVYLREEIRDVPPYRVENYSLETLRLHQYRVRTSEILLPHHTLDYAWDEPIRDKILVVDTLPSAAGDNSRPVRIGMFSLDTVQRFSDALNGSLGVEVVTDGPTRVLRFFDARLRNRVPMRVGETGTELARMENADRSSRNYLRRFVEFPALDIGVRLHGIGVSVVDADPKELLYISVSGLHMDVLHCRVSREDIFQRSASPLPSQLQDTPANARMASKLAFRLRLVDFQIDNQLVSTPFPVLLRFAAPMIQLRDDDEGNTLASPVVDVCVAHHDQYAGINFIEHFSAHTQPFHVRVDGTLLSQLVPFMAHRDESDVLKEKQILGRAFTSRLTVRSRESVGSLDEAIHRVKTQSRAMSRLLTDDFSASMENGARILELVDYESTLLGGGGSTPKDGIKLGIGQDRGQRPKLNMALVQAPSLPVDERPKLNIHPVAVPKGLALAKDQEKKKVYVEEFYMGTITATVSFVAGPGAETLTEHQQFAQQASTVRRSTVRTPSVVTVGPVRLILNAIGTSITKIANAPLQLKGLELRHSFLQLDGIRARFLAHYQREALRQAYVILGSVDVLGNPMIAWKNLKVGFYDFLFEPIYGLKRNSPKDFVSGIGRGTFSLVRASVYTCLDFHTRILSASALGLSEACHKLDEYTGYPVTRNVYQGIVQGLSGVVVAPIHSFEVSGIRGVFPGLVAGLFGLVLKPLLGLSVATSMTVASLRDAVDPNSRALLMRTRPPRFIDSRTKRLKVFSYVESLGEELVSRIRGGQYRLDGYLGHVDLQSQVLLVTKKRILMLEIKNKNKYGGSTYEVEWELLADEIILVEQVAAQERSAVTFYFIQQNPESGHFHGPARRLGHGQGSNQAAGSGALGLVTGGMIILKHVVPLAESKLLFVQAMMQQQDRRRRFQGQPHSNSSSSAENHDELAEDVTNWSGGSPSKVTRKETDTSGFPHFPHQYPVFMMKHGK